MPSRILSQKINTSNSISKLKPMEEIVFIHLLVSCDDYGRFYGNPDIINGMLFSRRRFPVQDIEKALRRLEEEKMIMRYSVDGDDYLELTSWMKFQKPRAKVSKFPDKTGAGGEEHMFADASIYEQPEVDEEQKKPADDSPVVYEMPLNSGDKHAVTANDMKNYSSLYPNVDIDQEIRKMIGWLQDNPSKRKTKAGIRRFIGSWLSKEQDKGRRNQVNVYVPNHAVHEDGYDGNPFR